MKKRSVGALAVLSLATMIAVASAQTAASQTVPVTVENYNRAQTDVNFAGVVKSGGFGAFRHGRELAPPAQGGIVRPNRDTLYSFAIVDLDAGPVTIALPDAGHRFMGMQVVNQDQYTRATYYGAGTHTRNDGDTIYKLMVKDVPVDDFWSLTVYNEQGYLQPNPYGAYALNSLTVVKDSSGVIHIQFGGCDGKIPNCLPIAKGWNYTVRLLRPRAEILHDEWRFPLAQPAI